MRVKLDKKKLVWKGFLIVIGAVALLGLIALLILHYYLSKMNIQTDGNVQPPILQQQAAPYPGSENNIVQGAELTPAESQNLQDAIDKNAASAVTKQMYQRDVLNILLIGADLRNIGENSRSDTMMLLSINKATKQITLTSLMRDVYLKIPNHGYNRLNAAYSYGGAPLVLDTIKENFKIDVKNYVEVNLYTFVKLVDALGGVTIDVAKGDIKNTNDAIKEQNYYLGRDENEGILTAAGVQHLSGNQALGYVRNREYQNGDFTRTQNQRVVVSQLYSKLFHRDLADLNKILVQYLPEVSTNITENQWVALLVGMMDYAEYPVNQIGVPEKGSFSYVTIRKMSVLKVDFAKNQQNMMEAIYGKAPG